MLLFFFVPGLSRHLGSRWGRRYSCLSSSSMLPCLLCCPLSAPPLLYSTCPPKIFPVLLFHSLHMAVPLQSFVSIIFLDACTTLVVPLMCSFRILSLLVTPHIHLSILISFTSSRASRLLVVAQVYAPYTRAGLTTVL